MNVGRNNFTDDEQDIESNYDDFEEKHGRGGVEKFSRVDNKGKYVPGKKKVKPRQLVDMDVY